ncbi:MAG: hypothetical protein M3O01_03280, partial [Pseudomonadota bacterium]|nr:hypothetical protein [Pseudomonadota bacterium]
MPNELSFSQSPLRPRPAHPERADRLPPLADPLADDPGLNRTATRTLRVLGWLATLGAVLTGLAIVMPTLTTSADDYPLDLLLF